jgi:hypothetical protein
VFISLAQVRLFPHVYSQRFATNVKPIMGGKPIYIIAVLVFPTATFNAEPGSLKIKQQKQCAP